MERPNPGTLSGGGGVRGEVGAPQKGWGRGDLLLASGLGPSELNTVLEESDLELESLGNRHSLVLSRKFRVP